MSHVHDELCPFRRYWINPVSWILYGFVASQLGQVDSEFTQVRRRLCQQFTAGRKKRLRTCLAVLRKQSCPLAHRPDQCLHAVAKPKPE